MKYLVLERPRNKATVFHFIGEGADLGIVYRMWLENPTERIIVKEVKIGIEEV